MMLRLIVTQSCLYVAAAVDNCCDNDAVSDFVIAIEHKVVANDKHAESVAISPSGQGKYLQASACVDNFFNVGFSRSRAIGRNIVEY